MLFEINERQIMKTRAITEGAITAAITVVIALLSYYIPLFSALSYFFVPIPTVIMYKRYGALPAFFESVTASIILIFFTGPINAVILGASIMLPGLLLGYTYRGFKTGGTRIVYGYIGYFLTILVELLIVQFLTGVTFVDEFVNEINDLTTTMMNAYSEAGLLDGSSGQTLESSITQLARTVEMLLPTIVLLFPALLSYCGVLMNDFIFRRLKLKYIPVKPITSWEINPPLKMILALTTIVVIFAGYMLQDSSYIIYTYTIETIISIIYTVMGFAFLFWVIQKKFNTKFIFLRISLLICCFVFTFLMSIVEIIGIFDIYFGLRRFFDKKKTYE